MIVEYEGVRFVFEEDDPNHELDLDPFLYVCSIQELQEKITLLKSSRAILEEAQKL